LKFKNHLAPLRGASILTIIVHSAVWSVDKTERWLVQYRIAAVELFIRTESFRAMQCGLWLHFQRRDAPSRIMRK